MRILQIILKWLIKFYIFLFIVLIGVFVYIQFFSINTKGTINIIWRDYTKNSYHEPLEFEYKLKKNGKNEYITYQLIPNETLSIELQGGKRCAIKSSANVRYWIEELGSDIEIILYDKSKIEKIDETTFVVDKLATDGILAYQLILKDESTGKMFKIISLDNIFEVKSILSENEMRNVSKNKDILECCTENDFAFYDNTYFGSGNGIYVRSLLTGAELSLEWLQ